MNSFISIKQDVTNKWEKLIKENSVQFTHIIDWDFIYCDVLIFNCSQYKITVDYNHKTFKLLSYLGHPDEVPKFIGIKLVDQNNIKISGNNQVINKEIIPKTVLYLEDYNFQ